MFVKIIRYLTSFFAFINLLLGVVVSGIGIYLISNKPKFWDLIHVGDVENKSNYESNVWGIISLGILTIISSVFGILGGKYKKKCALTCYSLCIFLLFGCFLAVGILMQVLYEPFLNNVKKDVNCNDDRTSLNFINDSNQLYLDAHQKYFCKKYDFQVAVGTPLDQQQCTCYVENKQEWTQKFGENFFQGYEITDDKVLGVTSVDQCKFPESQREKMQNYFDLQKEWAPFTAYLEEQFECSGICDPLPFYLFTNINAGIPYNNLYNGNMSTQGTGCLYKIVKFMEDFGTVTIIVSYIASGFFLLNIILSLCVCCYSTKNKKWDDYVNVAHFTDNN